MNRTSFRLRLPHILYAWLFTILFLSCHAEPAITQVRPRTVLSDSVRAYVVVDEPVIAIRGVQVFDGTGGGAKLNQTILIKEGAILDIGPIDEIRIPKQARILNMPGRTVIPGIVGTHNHMHMPGIHFMPFTATRLYLASGVTTIQTTGSAAPMKEKELAESIKRGDAIGPHIIHTGPYFSGPGGSPVMMKPESRQEVADTISYWVDQGVTWFKVYMHIKPDILEAVVEEAHARGAKVTGHLCSVTYKEAAAVGIDAIEHGFIHARDLSDDREPGVCSGSRAFRSVEDIDGSRVRQIHETMISNGVALSTTPAIFEAQVPERAVADSRTLEAMSPRWMLRHEAQQKRMHAAGSNWYFKPEWLHKSLQHDYLFYQRGGLLTAGLDPGLHNLPGFGDQRNYELLLEGGFPPGDAIKVLTSNGAELLDLHDRGTIQTGKRADLIILNGDLSRHTAVIRNVELVFKEGYGYDPHPMLEDIKGRVGID